MYSLPPKAGQAVRPAALMNFYTTVFSVPIAIGIILLSNLIVTVFIELLENHYTLFAGVIQNTGLGKNCVKKIGRRDVKMK